MANFYAWAILILEYVPSRRIYLALVTVLIKRKQLFDPTFYLSHNEDIAAKGLDPLKHYVSYGDREGRWPMPLFDPIFYAQKAGLEGKKRTNRLLHYAYVGRYLRFSPSPWFDTAFYLSVNKDVLRSKIDPLLHFLCWGGKEGRSPSPRFDSYHYLRNNPDVAEHGENPLVHYLQFGQYESRSPMANGESLNRIFSAATPSENDWRDLVPQCVHDSVTVSVIVPVYRNATVTLRCLYSVVRAQQRHTTFELIVINDASPDVQLVSALSDLAKKGFFTLLHNAENRGFVATANRAMTLYGSRDVVLLNSDTEVYGDWLDRLNAIANNGSNVGTVTPLSNNSFICSYPCFCNDNPYPLELSYQDLDALAKNVNAGSSIEAPSGIGFCLYIKKGCLESVGLFDQNLFGRGYGEENDFCRRAILKGWKNMIAPDVFVRHWGGASFQGEGFFLKQAAMEKLRQRYPFYQTEVDRFIAEDPLAAARTRLDRARLFRYIRRYNVLLVTHGRGGGTERHIAEEVERLQLTGRGAFIMRPEDYGEHVVITPPDIVALPNLGRFSLRERSALVSLLQQLPVHEVQIHQLIDYHRDTTQWILALAGELGAQIKVTIHDYTSICPRVNLVNHSGKYCREPAEAECNLCIKRNGSEFDIVDIAYWRESYHKLFAAAATIAVPDQDVSNRLKRYFPGIDFSVRPHEHLVVAKGAIAMPRLQQGERMRIVIIGAISRIKGYEVLTACANDAKERQLPLDFIVYGYSLNDTKLNREGVEVTGRYFEEYAAEGLAALKPHAVWLPSVWPETYSYTLSIALRGHLPVYAFRIGAIASRLKAIHAGQGLMPLEWMKKPQKINDFFLASGFENPLAGTERTAVKC
ncbi:MAG: glycosyltransferase [Gammaproteobacteria bacterium]